MRLKREGFVVRTAYFDRKADKIPQSANLCRLFWRFVLGMILTVWSYVVTGVINLLGFLFTMKLDGVLFSPWAPTPDLEEYGWWPTFRGKRVWPITLVVLGALVWGAVRWIRTFGSLKEFGAMTAATLISAVVFAIMMAAAIAVIYVIVLGIKKAWRTETTAFIKAWLKARRENVCPIVSIVTE